MRYNSDVWASWKKIRTAALRRARYRCEVIGCGIKGAKHLSVHHIIPRDEGGGDYEENLIVLCGPHHDEAEILRIRERSLICNVVEPISPKPPVPPMKRQVLKEIGAAQMEVVRIIEPEINKPKGERWWDKAIKEQGEERAHQPRESKKPGKILARLRRRLLALHRGFRCPSWGDVSKLCGYMKGGVWAWRVAQGDLYLSEEEASCILGKLPPPLWTKFNELDALVLKQFRWNLKHYKQRQYPFVMDDGSQRPIKGHILALFTEAHPRTIRSSVKRLREAGHRISASMAPPRGYWLEEEGDRPDTQEG